MVVSQDLQNIVVSGLLKSGYLVSLVETELTDSYFTDIPCKIIYKSLTNYYKKYHVMPNAQELMVAIDANYIDMGVPVESVKSTANTMIASPDVNEEFLVDKIVELIKLVRTNRALSRALDLIKNGNAMNDEKLANDLVNSLSVSISRSGIFTLGDTEALTLVRQKAIGDGSSSAVIKSILQGVNNSLQYRGYVKGTLNLIVSPPGTGKTSYLINEGSYASMQGFRVLHVFLGDMIHYDGFIRYASCLSGTMQDEVVAMSEQQQSDLVAKINAQFPDILNRIHVLAYGAGEVTVDKLTENIKKEQEKSGVIYDMIIIDYADNSDKGNVNLYAEGGEIYDKLALFGRVNHSVIMVASQPKIGYWDQEIIPLEGAAESSKKQHIVDLMMTFNLVARGEKLGSIFVPKVRRGTSGRIIRVQTAWEMCRMAEITEEVYNDEKAKLGML